MFGVEDELKDKISRLKDRVKELEEIVDKKHERPEIQAASERLREFIERHGYHYTAGLITARADLALLVAAAQGIPWADYDMATVKQGKDEIILGLREEVCAAQAGAQGDERARAIEECAQWLSDRAKEHERIAIDRIEADRTDEIALTHKSMSDTYHYAAQNIRGLLPPDAPRENK